MMQFLIQVDGKGIPMTEDGWLLMRYAEAFQEEYRVVSRTLGECSGTAKLADSVCPVGTVEFVHKCLGYEPKPMALFDKLPEYMVGRKFFLGDKEEFYYATETRHLDEPWPELRKLLNEKCFVKDVDRVKGSFRPDVMSWDQLMDKIDNDDPAKYMFSEVVEFECEWRAWCMGGRFLGMRPYILPEYRADGQPYEGQLVPHQELLEHWSSEFGKIYGETPVSFDLGLVRGVDEHWHTDGNRPETWQLIETHHCYSLGLYGFDDARRLAIMLWRTNLYLRVEGKK